MIKGTKDNAVLLKLTLPDRAVDLYPQITVRGTAGGLEGTYNMDYGNEGMYKTLSWTPSVNGYYMATVIVYTDSGHNTVSDEYTSPGATIKIDEMETNINDIEADTNEIQTDLTDGGRLDNILDAAAVEANVETHVTNSLNSYDPPTRTETTSDKNAIITEVDANETKIDIIDAIVDAILTDTSTTLDDKLDAIVGKLPTNYMMGSSVQTDKDDEIDDILADTNELQTDLANGGRLDLLLDAIKAKTDTILWTDITFIKNIEGGGWKRDGTKLYLYEDDNTTLVAEFDLKQADGSAADETDHVYQSDRV